MAPESDQRWDVEDLNYLFNNAPRVSDMEVEEAEILHLNPLVPQFASHKKTDATREDREHFQRTSQYSRDRKVHHGATKKHNFDDIKLTTLNEKGALQESARCLKCADAPCTRSCPTSIDIKMFIQCITTKNYYGAARSILSNNPVGLTCGMVCPTSELCVGSCNLSPTNAGPINISGLQEFACTQFMKMGVPQSREPSLKDLPASFKQPIAVVGSGPAGLCCANYLARLGYDDITVYEKDSYAGGLSTSEIPQMRCHYDGVRWEVRLCQDMGVKFQHNAELGKNLSISDLKAKHKAIFIGVGNYEAKRDKVFEGLNPAQGVWTSKDFLPLVCEASKPGCVSGSRALPQLSGHVIVLGAGDTAFDCVGSAFRCGAKRVTCVFRKSFVDMRAVYEERELVIREFCEFLPNTKPRKVVLDGEGRVCGLECVRMGNDDDDEPESRVGGYTEEPEAVYTLKCTAVITAFGCGISDEMQTAMKPLEFKKGVADLNEKHQCAADPSIFAGGDLAGAMMTVEAANDGKYAAWWMHEYLQKQHEAGMALPATPQLPMFHSAIDDVDISIEMCGVKFPNPFGLASAPCSTSASMMRRAFEAGWGFGVTKTFSLDEHLVTNISPRIVRGTYTNLYGPHQPGFINIELITEKTAAYWCKAIRELKDDFPDRVIVASVMVPYNEQQWKQVVKLGVDAGADIIELNLSCPHGMGEVGMGLACGQDTEMVTTICKWAKAAAGKCPVFPKLTNNITEIAIIGKAALEGGADGVTAINTIHGFQDMDPKGEGWPKVGSDKFMTSGGVCGDVNRPSTTRAVWSIKKFTPELEVMATGGISSAASTVQMLHMGAKVVQICSAIQNQDYTVVDDYISGLKSHLYQLGRKDFDKKEYQNSWESKRNWQEEALKVPVPSTTEKLPKFGPYLRERAAERRAQCEGQDPSTVKPDVPATLDDFTPRPLSGQAPPLSSIVGVAHRKYARLHTDLSREEQVMAIVNEDLCINCGRCYMVCNDSAYQAIAFTKDTHIPTILEDKCTGCGLCQAICPIPGCIEYRPMNHVYKPHRGLEAVHDRYRDEGKIL